jgi:hypothetical protein
MMLNLNKLVLELIEKRGLSTNDIKDVIAEQVYSAKSSDVEEVYYEAKRLERIFGSKYQQKNITEGYNKKADEFGGYFMTIVMEIQLKVGYGGVVECLQALEHSYYELQKSEKVVKVPTIELTDDIFDMEFTYFELSVIFTEVNEVKKMLQVFKSTNREIVFLHKEVFINKPEKVIDKLINDLAMYDEFYYLKDMVYKEFSREELEIIWTGVNVCMQICAHKKLFQCHSNIMKKIGPLLLEAGMS